MVIRSVSFVIVKDQIGGGAELFEPIPLIPLLNPPSRGKQGEAKAPCVTECALQMCEWMFSRLRCYAYGPAKTNTTVSLTAAEVVPGL